MYCNMSGRKTASAGKHSNGDEPDEVTDSTCPMQCSDDSPGQPNSPRGWRRSPTAEEKLEQLKIWERVLNDNYVYKRLLEYINGYDLLLYFHYMPTAWADEIKAVHTHQGQTSGAEKFLEHLVKLVDGENDWPQDLRVGLLQSGHDVLVQLLDETYEEVKKGFHDVSGGGDDSMIVAGRYENYSQDIGPAARAVCQHRELWIRTFRKHRKVIIESVEPITMLPHLPYLPRDRIRAVYDNQGETRAADELIETMFEFTDKAWMKDFIDALRAPRINRRLLADLLTNHFIDLIEETKDDPKYKDLHDVYAKSEHDDSGLDSRFIYYGAKTLKPKDLGAT